MKILPFTLLFTSLLTLSLTAFSKTDLNAQSFKKDIEYYNKRFLSYKLHLKKQEAFKKELKKSLIVYKKKKEREKAKKKKALQKYLLKRSSLKKRNFESGEKEYLKKLALEQKKKERERKEYQKHKKKLKEISEKYNYIPLEKELGL